MEDRSRKVAELYAELRDRSGVKMKEEAAALGLKGPSSVQRYGDPEKYRGGYLPWEMVGKLLKLWVGKGEPPIRQEEVLPLGGPDQLQLRRVNAAGEFTLTGPATFRPLFEGFIEDAYAGDSEARSFNSETGADGIPSGTIPEVDVTAGLGGGGVAIEVAAPGKNGVQLNADAVRDYWRLPDWVLGSIHAKPSMVAAIQTKGDSMEPTLMSGDVVFVDLAHRIPSPDGLYAILDEFGGVVVKRLETEGRDDDGEVIIAIIADNTRHSRKREKLSQLQVIGRVAGRFSVM